MSKLKVRTAQLIAKCQRFSARVLGTKASVNEKLAIVRDTSSTNRSNQEQPSRITQNKPLRLHVSQIPIELVSAEVQAAEDVRPLLRSEMPVEGRACVNIVRGFGYFVQRRVRTARL